MKCDSKAIVTYTIEGEDQVISADHETGDDEIYVRSSKNGEAREIVFAVSISEAKDLSDALQNLAIKMEFEKGKKPVVSECTMITYPFGADEKSVDYKCKNGFVARCIGNIENVPDAKWCCEVLNKYGHLVKHEAETMEA